MSNFKTDYLTLFKNFKTQLNEPLAPFTSWKIGGSAEVLIQTKNSQELLEVLKICLEKNLKWTILGRGSNVLISDQGLKEVVIINQSKEMQILDQINQLDDLHQIQKDSQQYDYESPYIEPRHSETGDKDFYSFEDLDFQESGKKQTVKIDSGVFLPLAISWSLKNGLTGLQWFSGIPGSIGGSLYNNIHGGTHHFSEYFKLAKVLIPKTDKKAVERLKDLIQKEELETSEQTIDKDFAKSFHKSKFPKNQILTEADKFVIALVNFDFFEFGYDQSFLRRKENQIMVLEVYLDLFQADEKQLEKAKKTAREWAKRKKIQPKKSCGSVFQALPEEVQKKLGYPTPSAGYIIDKILNLKGKEIGGAKIAKEHANFIINNKKAKASEVMALIQEIQTQAKAKLGVDLELEINLLGFE